MHLKQRGREIVGLHALPPDQPVWKSNRTCLCLRKWRGRCQCHDTDDRTHDA